MVCGSEAEAGVELGEEGKRAVGLLVSGMPRGGASGFYRVKGRRQGWEVVMTPGEHKSQAPTVFQAPTAAGSQFRL